MDRASKLLVLANFLLVAVTLGLLIATALYAAASWYMIKAAKQQAAFIAVQGYLYLMKEDMGKLSPATMTFKERFDDDFNDLLDIAFDFDRRFQ